MKHAWGDPPALAAWTWTAATSAAGAHCRWPYVQCDSSSRVTTLKLVSVNITGPISDAIGVFSNLAKLDLSNNSIDRRPACSQRCSTAVAHSSTSTCPFPEQHRWRAPP
ncbi:hypothetical protein BDA96_07G046300 [Sorghum bicolor]|uniref:Leucine-rich repeat-containing N-terminal plant-type domain-containing protein n=1 Tax=Sorghum bicolor TaxID=4558 RepID=A0A921QIG5_SORBI|nr:hypothetical protein BDA96_07G046300 [Sorghum bicolor]